MQLVGPDEYRVHSCGTGKYKASVLSRSFVGQLRAHAEGFEWVEREHGHRAT
jgi:hypothetical protein